MDRVHASSHARVGIVGSGPRAESVVRRMAAAAGPVAWFDPASGQRRGGSLAGAPPCRTLGELRSSVDAIVTSFEDEEGLRQIVLGEGGLARLPGDALSVLDVSPLSPWVLQDLAAHCCRTDVKLFGGILVTADAETVPRLKLYVDRGALEADVLRDVLVRLADDVVPTGAAGTAKAVGILNELLVGVNTAVVCEAVALGRSAGLDRRTLERLVLTGSGATQVMARRLAAEDSGSPASFTADDFGCVRRGVERAMAAAHRVDHSLFFGSVAIASLLTQGRAASGAGVPDGCASVWA